MIKAKIGAYLKDLWSDCEPLSNEGFVGQTLPPISLIPR
jgi:hypothetical protein